MKVIGTDGKEYTIEPRADLDGANLRGANLRGTDLRNAYLSEVDLRGANLSVAVWNGETVFPKGFEIPDELQG